MNREQRHANTRDRAFACYPRALYENKAWAAKLGGPRKYSEGHRSTLNFICTRDKISNRNPENTKRYPTSPRLYRVTGNIFRRGEICRKFKSERVVNYKARNSAAVKSVTKASQWRKIETRRRRRKGREAFELQVDSKRQSFETLYDRVKQCRKRKRMNAAEQFNDGASTSAAGAVEIMQVDEEIASNQDETM
ncbi:hypothetical protein EVAR_36310_1 [Eumeta japonica]|uniref:Uncharacterized protein n=1 Tax=Eumeta variegata TaxID=151549 RepID=A0A4C1VGW8_EUMVA|nr:hypothetical protein EVAR_36310_1 [Eumeta japonica]